MADKSIFITGGSGFVGKAIVRELLDREYKVRALVRHKSIDRTGVESIEGDLFDDRALDLGMKNCDAVIHLVGIIREQHNRGQTFERIHSEGSSSIIRAALRNGVKRFLHMSAIGASLIRPSGYARSKAQAENALKQSDLDYTIFRPSIVHGPDGEFMQMLAKWVMGKKMPWIFMPYFGKGLIGNASALVQPVYVADVARAFVDAIGKPELIHQVIDLAGPQQMSWPQMYHIVSETLIGKRKMVVGVPVWYARLLTMISPACLLPFNRAQVEMAGQDNISSIDTFALHFGFTGTCLGDALRRYGEDLRQNVLSQR